MSGWRLRLANSDMAYHAPLGVQRGPCPRRFWRKDEFQLVLGSGKKPKAGTGQDREVAAELAMPTCGEVMAEKCGCVTLAVVVVIRASSDTKNLPASNCREACRQTWFGRT
jgi:hypothetical protein